MRIEIEIETIVKTQKTDANTFLSELKNFIKKFKHSKIDINVIDSKNEKTRKFIINCFALTESKLNSISYNHAILYEDEKVISKSIFWVIAKGRSTLVKDLAIDGEYKTGIKAIKLYLNKMIKDNDIIEENYIRSIFYKLNSESINWELKTKCLKK